MAKYQNTKYLNNNTLNLVEILLTLKKRYKLILISTLISTAIAIAVSYQLPDKYLVKTTVEFSYFYKAVLPSEGELTIKKVYLEPTTTQASRLNKLFVRPAAINKIESISLLPDETAIVITAVADSNARANELIKEVLNELNKPIANLNNDDPQGLLLAASELRTAKSAESDWTTYTLPHLQSSLQNKIVEKAFFHRLLKQNKSFLIASSRRKTDSFRNLLNIYQNIILMLTETQKQIMEIKAEIQSSQEEILPELQKRTEKLADLYKVLSTIKTNHPSTIIGPVIQSDHPFNSKKKLVVFMILLAVFIGSSLLAFFLDLVEEQKELAQKQQMTSET